MLLAQSLLDLGERYPYLVDFDNTDAQKLSASLDDVCTAHSAFSHCSKILLLLFHSWNRLSCGKSFQASVVTIPFNVL